MWEGLTGTCDFLLLLLMHMFLIPSVTSLKAGTLITYLDTANT